MIVSEARVAANRRNAAKSTGPKTVEGKQRVRANALKHGLCSSVVVPEDASLVQRRALEFFEALRPQNPYQAWLVDQVAILSIRIDRSERIERRVRDKVALRAETCWDDRGRVDAEFLGSGLATRPGEVVELLRQSPQGCDWLMSRWAMLAHSAEVQAQGWTADQVKLAFDLLATPGPFRPGHTPGAGLDLQGRVVEPVGEQASLARREIAELQARRVEVAELDEIERALTGADLNNDGDAELRRLRRYEGGLHRRLRWCLSQIQDPKPARPPSPGHLRPKWDETTEPTPIVTPKPEPKTEAEVAAEGWQPGTVQPPFDLEPDEFPEPGQNANIPAILQTRREKRLAKAQSRREARRRKVEQLRA